MTKKEFAQRNPDLTPAQRAAAWKSRRRTLKINRPKTAAHKLAVARNHAAAKLAQDMREGVVA